MKSDIEKIIRKLEFEPSPRADHPQSLYIKEAGAKQENTRLLTLIRPLLDDLQQAIDAVVLLRKNPECACGMRNCMKCYSFCLARTAADEALTQHAETVKKILEMER